MASGPKQGYWIQAVIRGKEYRPVHELSDRHRNTNINRGTYLDFWSICNPLVFILQQFIPDILACATIKPQTLHQNLICLILLKQITNQEFPRDHTQERIFHKRPVLEPGKQQHP